MVRSFFFLGFWFTSVARLMASMRSRFGLAFQLVVFQLLSPFNSAYIIGVT